MPRMRAVVQGLGQLGRCAVEQCSAHPDIDLVAVATRRPETANWLPDGVRIMASLAELTTEDRGCVVVHTTHALGDELVETLSDAARAGADVVTSSGFFHPRTQMADGGEALDRLARKHGTRVISSGVQPGFVFEALPAQLLDLAPGWREVVLTKPSDARSWPVEIRHMQGIGGPPAALEASLPYPLGASAHLLAEALGLRVADLEETRTALLSDKETVLADETIPTGAAVGFAHECRARLNDGRSVRLRWEPTVDMTEDTDLVLRLDVTEGPWLSVRLDGAFRENPYPATVARMLHTVAAARSLPPGLHRVTDAALGWG